VTATPAGSRPRRAASVGIGVAVCVGLVVVVINPWLGWFVLAGIVVGLAALWLIAAVRHRRWWRLAIAVLMIVVVSFFAFEWFFGPRAPGPRTSVPISATMEYRADKQTFEITDTLVLTDEGSTAICVSDQRMSGQSQQPSGDAGGVDCASAGARDSYARTAVKKAGWTHKDNDDYDGHPVFTRSREVAVEVPRWWPLSVTRSVDAPRVELLYNSFLVADANSTLTIIGPKYFVRQTEPRGSSTERLDGSEETRVPIGYDKTGAWDSRVVGLELVSWVARNPVVAPLVHFSWWAPVKWIVLLVAGVVVAVFRDQLKDLIRWLFGSLARRTGSRKKPDAVSGGRHRAGG
jgi:energy-coupling factor transporter transmembrane protein EcfT